jgi:hypothetical protein
MAQITTFRQLTAWQQAHKLVLEVYTPYSQMTDFTDKEEL